MTPKPHLSQLERLVWYPTGAGPGHAYPVNDVDVNILTGDFPDNTAVMGIPGPYHKPPGSRRAEISFTSYPCGSGTAGDEPFDDELLTACGWGKTIGTGVSVTYTHMNGRAAAPKFHIDSISASGEIYPIDILKYTDEYKQVALSCVGNQVLTIKAGEIVKNAWNFIGNYSTEPSESASAEDEGVNGVGLPNWDPLPALNLTASIAAGGFAGPLTSEIDEISFDLGNTLTTRPDMTATHGYAIPVITKTEPKLTFSVEVPDMTTHGEFWAEAIAENSVTINAIFGAGGGNIVTLNFVGYFDEYPTVSETDGKLFISGVLLEDPDNPATLIYS